MGGGNIASSGGHRSLEEDRHKIDADTKLGKHGHRYSLRVTGSQCESQRNGRVQVLEELTAWSKSEPWSAVMK